MNVAPSNKLTFIQNYSLPEKNSRYDGVNTLDGFQSWSGLVGILHLGLGEGARMVVILVVVVWVVVVVIVLVMMVLVMSYMFMVVMAGHAYGGI